MNADLLTNSPAYHPSDFSSSAEYKLFYMAHVALTAV